MTISVLHNAGSRAYAYEKVYCSTFISIMAVSLGGAFGTVYIRFFFKLVTFVAKAGKYCISKFRQAVCFVAVSYGTRQDALHLALEHRQRGALV